MYSIFPWALTIKTATKNSSQQPRWRYRVATLLLLLLIGGSLSAASHGEQAAVAVAANFTEAAKQLRSAFEQSSPHTVKMSYGSTGKLFTQINHGAPFDVFLAADSVRPGWLLENQMAVAGTNYSYAQGKLVLYARDKNLALDESSVVNTQQIKRIAIANPKTAPYGAAAQSVLTKLGHTENKGAKIIQGDSIVQTFQFTFTGNVDAGFVALSQVAKDPKANYWLVPQALYPPLTQDAVLLKRGQSNEAAKAFMTFLKGPEARQIIQRLGYEVP